jgi:hypothetical protein
VLVQEAIDALELDAEAFLSHDSCPVICESEIVQVLDSSSGHSVEEPASEDPETLNQDPSDHRSGHSCVSSGLERDPEAGREPDALDCSEAEFELDAEAFLSHDVCFSQPTSPSELSPTCANLQNNEDVHVVAEGFSIKKSLLRGNVPGFGAPGGSDVQHVFEQFGKKKPSVTGSGFCDVRLPVAVANSQPASSSQATLPPGHVKAVEVNDTGFFAGGRAQSFHKHASTSKYIQKHGIDDEAITKRVRSLSKSQIINVDSVPHFVKLDNDKHEHDKDSDTPEF